MVATKEVYINGEKIFHGTNIKGSRNTNANSTPTFDGVVTAGTVNIAYSLEISRVSYEGYATYKKVSDIIEDMLENPGIITVVETHILPNEQFKVTYDYHDCVVDGDDYEIKPEERTVENMKFLCGSMDKDIKPL